MTLTAIVGALVALVARPAKPVNTADHADQTIARLARSHARLVDHIERLERELAMAQQMLDHWRGEARRLARIARQERDERQRQRYHPQQAQIDAMMQAAHGQMLAQQAAQLQNPQMLGQQSDYQGFCNCVPARSQMWFAQQAVEQHALVNRLNQGEE